jgi:hypothetical protein
MVRYNSTAFSTSRDSIASFAARCVAARNRRFYSRPSASTFPYRSSPRKLPESALVFSQQFEILQDLGLPEVSVEEVNVHPQFASSQVTAGQTPR